MTNTANHSFAQAVLSFGRLLKENGFAVSPPIVMDALEGVRRVGIDDPKVFKTVLKATFMTRIEEDPSFERLFHEFWLNREAGDENILLEYKPGGDDGEDDEDETGDTESLEEVGEAEAQEDEASITRPNEFYSPQEVLREKDFKELPQGHDYRMARLIREIVSPLVRRSGVRRRPATSGTAVDFRRLMRKSSAHGGEILELPRLKPKPRIKKIVFLCDVSGSMNPYLMFVLRFIKELHALPTRVESFVFATRLSRITPFLVHLPFNRAMERIAETVADWSGGTRIGSCLHDFIDRHGGQMLRPSTVILIHSDGWDRGEPEILTRTMSTIRRRAHRLIWINPLLGGPAYEPTCRGMKTALPYVDYFLPGHSIAALERVAGTLRGLF